MNEALLGMTQDELSTAVQELGEPGYRGRQIAEWIYRQGASTIGQMTTLPKALRTKLSECYEVGRSPVVSTSRGRDRTTKLLLKLRDGETIETVGIPYADRFSCCVSTQVGCSIHCVFCATGQSGYKRNLTAGEIVDQVLTVQDMARSLQLPVKDATCKVSHVVFMGMGEPLLNYEATMKAIRIMNTEMGIGMRHLTVSTVGFIPGIRRLAQENLQITLAISLHAPTDELRAMLLPTMREWRVNDIINTCREYVQTTGRRITFEYCLLRGTNDGTKEAQEVARILRGLNCHVNLIPFNAVHPLPYRAPGKDTIRAFRETLENAGITVTQRLQRGAAISAACGQLRQRAATANKS